MSTLSWCHTWANPHPPSQSRAPEYDIASVRSMHPGALCTESGKGGKKLAFT